MLCSFVFPVRVVHCFFVLFVFFRVLRFVAIIRFLWCHSFFSVLLVFCGVIRFSVQCGGFPRSSFFRVVRLRRVPVPYVRLLVTPIPYVRLLLSRDTTLETCKLQIPLARSTGKARNV